MLITPLVLLLAVGVNKAAYFVPLPLKLESVPPATVTSPTTKLEDDSLKVNVMMAVCEAVRLVALEVTTMVGAVVSATTVLTNMVTVLLVSVPSALTLPAASEKTLLATRTTPLVVLLAVGVNNAV